MYNNNTNQLSLSLSLSLSLFILPIFLLKPAYPVPLDAVAHTLTHSLSHSQSPFVRSCLIMPDKQSRNISIVL